MMKDMPMLKRYKWGDAVAFCVNLEQDAGDDVEHEEGIHVHTPHSACGWISAAVDKLHECLELAIVMKESLSVAPTTNEITYEVKEEVIEEMISKLILANSYLT